MIDAGPLPPRLYHFVNFPFFSPTMYVTFLMSVSRPRVLLAGCMLSIGDLEASYSLTATLLLVIFFASSSSFIHLHVPSFLIFLRASPVQGVWDSES